MIAVIVIVTATFATGIDSKCLQVCHLTELISDQGYDHIAIDAEIARESAVQEGRERAARGRRHPVRVRLLPLRVRHGRHVLRYALRRLERQSNHGEVIIPAITTSTGL